VDGHEVALVGSGDDIKKDPESQGEQWKLAQVVSYQVTEKQRENRPKPFYQDYRHYKYYGAQQKSSSLQTSLQNLLDPHVCTLQLNRSRTLLDSAGLPILLACCAPIRGALRPSLCMCYVLHRVFYVRKRGICPAVMKFAASEACDQDRWTAQIYLLMMMI
jgi:hypothetical protein